MKSEVTENLSCEFSEAIVPYLYGESTEAERDRFETHMADCSPCTDEFAELSFSRYSVFEWQKEEFAPMATPQIVIPYGIKQAESAGLMAGLRELFGFNWASAVGAAAALAIIAGLGFVAVNFFGSSQPQIAAIDETNSNIQVAKPQSPKVIPDVESKVEVVAKAPKVESERSIHPVKASTNIRRPKQTTTASSSSPRLINNDAVNIPRRQEVRSPSLTADADDDDKSLRLTDLFETVDTRR